MTVFDLALRPVRFPEEAMSLRAEVRAFLDEQIDGGAFVPACDTWLGGFSSDFSRELGRRGWVGMTWPAAYGGHGRSAIERFVVIEELLAAGAPVAAHWVSDRQTGAALLKYGTEEQRLRFLPGMARGETYFAIGMSEPDSGSDLASVATRAERTESGWRLNGTKVWTSNAHRVQYMLTLCRTTPRSQTDRHGGLSQFIVDLQTPGVQVRPILLMNGEHHFNEVILENVEIPDELVLGEIGNGWEQVGSELAYERSGPERFLSTFPLFKAFVAVAGAQPDARSHAVVGEVAARVWAVRQMSLGVAGALDVGAAPDVQAALVKDVGTTLEQEMVDLIRRALPPEPGGHLESLLAQATLHAPGFTLRGGTNEILRSIISKGLGL
ncbi:MAG: acyl-CoA dehydrogenase family protein [Actinomycetota bacterium]